MLIMGMSVERYPLGAILLLRGLQLSEHFTVSADLLTLQLLGVRDVGEKFADAVELPAESVDIVAEVRAVIIVSLILDGLDNRSHLGDALVEVFQLTINLALDHFQIGNHNADSHH